jgi:hypothetical protein
MSVRPPNLANLQAGRQSGLNVLDYEMMEERAAALGEAGRALERALRDLHAHDTGNRKEDSAATREAFLQNAADRAWALFIQFELCGLSSQRKLVKRYRIPGEVLARVGIRGKSGKR